MTTEAPRGTMCYCFTRHGEAEHNVVIAEGRALKDEALVKRGRSLLDPALTEKGRDQAKTLGARLAGRRFRVVVTSPLARALETARLIVEQSQHTPRVVVTSLHTESGVPVPGDDVAGQRCQRGRRSLREVQADTGWDCHEPWHSGDGAYFHPQPVDERLAPFKAFLLSLCADDNVGGDVLVVGHSGFFARFLGGPKLANCDILELPADSSFFCCSSSSDTSSSS